MLEGDLPSHWSLDPAVMEILWSNPAEGSMTRLSLFYSAWVAWGNGQKQRGSLFWMGSRMFLLRERNGKSVMPWDTDPPRTLEPRGPHRQVNAT